MYVDIMMLCSCNQNHWKIFNVQPIVIQALNDILTYVHPQICSHNLTALVVIVLNYTPHYSHRHNNNIQDLPAKRQRLQGKWTTNKKE